MKMRVLLKKLVAGLLVGLFATLSVASSPASAQAGLFTPDPPVAGETTSISVGPIEQSVGYACVLFNPDGSCATYRICPSPSSVVYRITFTSPTGETTTVVLDSEFTPADPYPQAPNGGTSGEFMLTGEFVFPEGGEWQYQTQITRTNICGSNQTAISQPTDFMVAEDAVIPVVHPAGLLAAAVVAGPYVAIRRRRKLHS